MADETTDGLTASEQAYFESGGTTEVVEAAETGEQATTERVVTEQIEQPELSSQERDDKGRFVPHGALHAEREEHKKTKAVLEEVQRNQAILNDRWNTLLATGKPQQEEVKDETPPDPSVDIIAYMQWQAKQTNQINEKMASEERQRQETAQYQQQEQVIWSAWDNSVSQAKASIPDFDQAAVFLSQLRDNQLQAFTNIDPTFSNPQARVAQINAELRQIIIQAKQAGQDPATAVYQIAQGYGYTAANTLNPQQQTIDKINKIDEAQRGSKTLTASNGTNTGDPLSADALAAMPVKEFEAWLKDPANERRFNTLMGG